VVGQHKRKERRRKEKEKNEKKEMVLPYLDACSDGSLLLISISSLSPP